MRRGVARRELTPDEIRHLLLLEGEGDDRIETLTNRERGVLKLVLDGKSNKEIARTLVLTDKTVEKHVSALFTKLGGFVARGVVILDTPRNAATSVSAPAWPRGEGHSRSAVSTEDRVSRMFRDRWLASRPHG